MGPFVGFLPGVVVQSNDFMYMHTTGDTPDNVGWSGLEAATRAYAKIVDDVNKLPLKAWIKDSSAMCKAKTAP